MRFAAYEQRRGTVDFSFEGRNDAAGILGSCTLSEATPVVTACSLEELKREVRAYLGTEPAAILYLTDGDCRVYEIVINKKHHAAVDKAERRLGISVALLIFSITCLLAASLGSHGAWALLLFAGVVSIYGLIVGTGISNEIEGAVTCEILLILTLLLTPTPERARTSSDIATTDSNLLAITENFPSLLIH